MVELLYAAGARVSELYGLDIDDLDSNRNTIRVLGKGNKERTIPMGKPAVQVLEVWLSKGREDLATELSAKAVFLGARGGRIEQRTASFIKKTTYLFFGGVSKKFPINLSSLFAPITP